MAKVFIPFSLQELTGGLRELEIAGSNVREIIDQLERRYPGAREQFVEGNHLRLNITVAVDGEISPMGLLEEVGEDSEVHFVAAIRGGSPPRPVRGSYIREPALKRADSRLIEHFPGNYGRRPTRSATRRTNS